MHNQITFFSYTINLPNQYNEPLFYNGKRKIATNFHTKHIEAMIEYTLISSILDRICKMTTKPWECPRDDTQLLPLQHLLEIKTWGIEWKRAIDKTSEWVAWQWANAKINKKKSCITKTNYNILNEDMEDYHQVMFTHAMDFFLNVQI